jgi:hypothetical protein
MRGKTISIYLPDGNPKGIKICEMPTSVAKGILIPRNKLKDASDYSDLAKVGLYFLVSEKDEADLAQVYIGEAEELLKRLKQHDTQKEEYWNYAIAFLSTKNNLNKAHVKFLENHCYTQAKDFGRCYVKNSVIPTQSSIIGQEKDFVLDFFDEIRILLGTLGYPIFEETEKNGTLELFYCKGKDAEATGNFTEEGFMIQNGSKANLTESPSSGSWLINMRKKLVTEGILKQEGNILLFTKPVELGSPTAAAQAILGRSANGWTEWKSKDGKTIDEIKRKENKQ